MFRCEIPTGKTLDMRLGIKNTNLFSIMYPCQAFHSWSSLFQGEVKLLTVKY